MRIIIITALLLVCSDILNKKVNGVVGRKGTL